MMQRVSIAALFAFVAAGAGWSQTPAVSEKQKLPAYRSRLLGVYSSSSGEPIEGAEVIDLFTKTKAITTATGTVTLSFLPEGGSMVRIQKIGYEPFTQIIPISPEDTVPATILLHPLAQRLPTVVTKDSAPSHVSLALRAFEERRLSGNGGKFITEAQLRKSDNRSMTNVIRELGVPVRCLKKPPYSCWASSSRQGSKFAILGGYCDMDIYLDGNKISTEDARDLQIMHVNEIGAVEAYMGPASIPQVYNQTGSSCGVLLLWSRER